MSLVTADAYGSVYEFSLGDEDMPDISNFVTQKLELNLEPALKEYARDELGVIKAMVTSKPDRRKITATITGYIIKGITPAQLPSTFTFENRFFMICCIGNPRLQGDFNTLTLTAESHSGIVSLGIG